MAMTPEEIKAALWELTTVDARKVGRWLNNNIAAKFDAVELASMRHADVGAKIYNLYNSHDIEKSLNQLKAERPPDTGESVIDQATLDARNRERLSRGDSSRIHQTIHGPAIMPRESPSRDQTAWTRNQIMGEFRVGIDEAHRVPDLTPGVVNYDQAVKDMTPEQQKEALIKARLNQGITPEQLKQKLVGYATVQMLETYKTNTGSVISEWGSKLNKRLQEIQDLVLSTQATTVDIRLPDQRVIPLGLVHRDTPKLIKFLNQGIHVFLTGPSGSGKSIGAEKAAQALELPFYSISVCSQTTKTELLGYMDATGVYRQTQFRDAYENGGAFLFDEIDAGNANVLAVLNNTLSGSKCPFPDKMVTRHPKFRCIAAGNTWGTGKTMQYVGRNALDAATLNRFATIFWDYDEALETALTELPAWSKYVQACRAEIKRRGVQVLVTPRASISGAKLLRAGLDVQTVIDTLLFPNIDDELRRQLPANPTIRLGPDTSSGGVVQ